VSEASNIPDLDNNKWIPPSYSFVKVNLW
jgi:hypothetical protein